MQIKFLHILLGIIGIFLISLVFLGSANKDVYTFYIKPIIVEPNSEIMICEYRTLEKDLQVNGFVPDFSQPIHHTLLWLGDGTVDDGIKNCTLLPEGSAGNHQTYHGASGTEDKIMFPKDTGIVIKKGTPLIFQVHYINHESTAQEIESKLNIILSHEPLQKEVKFGFHQNDSLLIPSGDHQEKMEFGFDKNVKIVALGLHMHNFGKVFKVFYIQENKKILLHEEKWDFLRPLNYIFPKNLVLKEGEMIGFECDYNNPTSLEIRYPREMCLLAYYYVEE